MQMGFGLIHSNLDAIIQNEHLTCNILYFYVFIGNKDTGKLIILSVFFTDCKHLKKIPICEQQGIKNGLIRFCSRNRRVLSRIVWI